MPRCCGRCRRPGGDSDTAASGAPHALRGSTAVQVPSAARSIVSLLEMAGGAFLGPPRRFFVFLWKPMTGVAPDDRNHVCHREVNKVAKNRGAGILLLIRFYL